MKNLSRVFVFVVFTLGFSACSIAVEKNAASTLMVEVEFSGDIYSIKRAWVIDKALPSFTSAGNRAGDVVITISDSNESIIASSKIRNPRILRGPLMPPEERAKMGADYIDSHSTIILDSGSFIVRLPYTADVQYLNFVESKKGISAMGQTVESKQRLDLSTYLGK